jgi:hypothetical protein
MKPTLRLIHHLHRTGGTLICKCIASLPNISLLSEMHPNAPKDYAVLDPVFQASFWLRLFNDKTANQLSDKSFAEKIKTIDSCIKNRGDKLIIRNWAYPDFFATPFWEKVPNQLSTCEVLKDHFELKQLVTVRHPMDQWLSWCAYKGTEKATAYTFHTFIDSCCEFQKRTNDIPFIRYEDFVEAPGIVMQDICEHLDLKYDPIFLQRWPYYHQITGDDNDRASGNWSISPRPRRIPDTELEAEAMKN